MPFKISGNAKLLNLNVRKDGPSEEQRLATDLKLECYIHAQELDQLVGESDSLYGALYDEQGNSPRFDNLLDVALDAEFKDHDFYVKPLDKMFHVTKVDKFAAHLRINGVATLVFRVQLHPTSDECGDLAELVKEDFEFSIAGQPDLFDGQNEGSESEENTTPGA